MRNLLNFGFARNKENLLAGNNEKEHATDNPQACQTADLVEKAVDMRTVLYIPADRFAKGEKRTFIMLLLHSAQPW